MEDLLHSQIKASCKLALPNGLKELMADISREVIRDQPKDIYRFITEYLSVLLVTRENLSIASRICSEVCDGCCDAELYDELRNIGLQPDDAETAKVIVMKYFHGDKVNEGKLLTELMGKMDLDEDLLPDIRGAVRTAFLRHQESRIVELETLSDIDEVSRAAVHTLQLYTNVDTTDEEYQRMAEKIGAAYRAYGVKREKCFKEVPLAQDAFSHSDDHTQANFEMAANAEEIITSWNTHKISIGTISSTSLAGSYLKLPKYKPYSAIDANQLNELEETPGKEHSNVGYTTAKGGREKVKIVIAEEEKRRNFEKHPRNDINDDSDEGSIEEITDMHFNEACDEEPEDLAEVDESQVIDDSDDEVNSVTGTI